MSTISSTGIGSGLDIDSLVSKLVAAERSAGQTRIDGKKTRLTEEFSAMATLMGGMSATAAAVFGGMLLTGCDDDDGGNG